MSKPSPQFIQKLEHKLRMAYRGQFAPEALRRPVPQHSGTPALFQHDPVAGFSWRRLLTFLIPSLSAMALAVVLVINFVFQNPSSSQTLATIAANNLPSENDLATFNVGKEEEELVADFDNDELNQIDRGVALAVAQ